MTVRGECDVGRFQVAVNDPAVVRRLQRVGDLARDRNRVTHADRPSGQALSQRASLDELHDEELRPLRLAG